MTIAFHWASTTQYQPSLHLSTKHSVPSDFQMSPRKKSTYAAAGSNNCFCCGFTGHLTSQCTLPLWSLEGQLPPLHPTEKVTMNLLPQMNITSHCKHCSVFSHEIWRKNWIKRYYILLPIFWVRTEILYVIFVVWFTRDQSSTTLLFCSA